MQYRSVGIQILLTVWSSNAKTIRKSAREIDDILTQVGNQYPSTIVRSDAKTITPWDSASQISVQSSKTKSSLIEKAVGIWCQRGTSRWVQTICSFATFATFADNRKHSERSCEQKRLQKAKPPFPTSGSSWTPPAYLNTYEASM
jgi:hypothetical protein